MTGARPDGATAVAPDDTRAVRAQLGREPRGLRAVAHRCSCGLPDVVETAPRLADGTPFPTLYYLTCPRATAAVGTLEAQGLMRELQRRLADEPDLAAGYRRAHDDYLARRSQVERLDELEGVSAGGMPTRVKCLHALVAHSLAGGPGANPVGDLVLGRLADWGAPGRCVDVPRDQGTGPRG